MVISRGTAPLRNERNKKTCTLLDSGIFPGARWQDLAQIGHLWSRHIISMAAYRLSLAGVVDISTMEPFYAGNTTMRVSRKRNENDVEGTFFPPPA